MPTPTLTSEDMEIMMARFDSNHIVQAQATRTLETISSGLAAPPIPSGDPYQERMPALGRGAFGSTTS